LSFQLLWNILLYLLLTVFKKKIASSTVLTYMSAISFLLQLGGYEDLTGHFIISKALRGYHKEKAAFPLVANKTIGNEPDKLPYYCCY
jgi:hypothetical protein